MCKEVHSWDASWVACPAWYAYSRHARCPDELRCETAPTAAELHDMCLEFMYDVVCAADPNAMRVLAEQCADHSFGAAQGESCTPWDYGSSPCADGQCVNVIAQNETQGPACYPNSDTFDAADTVPDEYMMCSDDSDCLASYECLGGAPQLRAIFHRARLMKLPLGP